MKIKCPLQFIDSTYNFRFQIAGDNRINHCFVEPEIGKSGQVVLELTEGVPKGTQLYFNNWFNSPLLIKTFGEMGIGATGTVRQNRKAGCPLKAEKVLKKEGRGAYDYQSSDGVVVCDWFDNRLVTVASNYHSVEPTTTQRRWNSKEKKFVNIPCPNLVTAYNKSMGGVDKCDMMVSLYRMSMKGRKWYKRLFFHFTDLAVINAWTMLRQTTQPKLKLVNFKMDVAVALLKGNLLPHPISGMPSRASSSPRQGFVARLTAASPAIAGPAVAGPAVAGPAIAGPAVAGHVVAGGSPSSEDDGSSQDRPDPRSASAVNRSVRQDGWGHLPRMLARLPKYCKMEGCKRRTRIYCVKCNVYLCLDQTSDCFYNFHI